jgi:hypothetical protein
VAARLDPDRAEAAGFAGLAARLLERLAGAFYGGPYGIWIVPAMAPAPFAPPAGVDKYVSVTSYAALTAVALSWPAGRAPAARAPAAPGALTEALGPDAFAAVRRRGVWFAVREHGARDSHGDLRSDFGLVALERTSGGPAERLLWLRPRTRGGGDSAGPVLRTGGRTGYPDGTRIRTTGRGTVVVTGGWRDRRGRWLRRGVFRFRAAGGGVRVSFTLRAGDRVSYSVFAPDPRRTDRAIVDGRARTTLSLPARLWLTAGYASGESPALTRATLNARARRSGTVSIVIRPA